MKGGKSMKKKLDLFVIPAWSLIGSLVVHYLNFGISVALYKVFGVTSAGLDIAGDVIQLIVAAAAYVLIGLFVCRKYERKEILISSGILSVYLVIIRIIYEAGLQDYLGILAFPERMYRPISGWIYHLGANSPVAWNILYWLTIVIDIAIIMTYSLWAKKSDKAQTVSD